MNSLRGLPTARVGPVTFQVSKFAPAVEAVLAQAGELGGAARSMPVGESSSLRAAEKQSGVAIHFANAYSVALADVDPAYAALLSSAESVVFTDGLPVAWAGRRLHKNVAAEWDRVHGPGMMEAVFDRSTDAGPTHYLLGGSPETLMELRSAIEVRWPSLRLVGSESPPFRMLTAEEKLEQDHRIRDSGAQIVWVGLGSPKQDWETARIAGEIPAVVLAVGAAFDFLAGTKPQAPEWMRRSGTEWFYRLATEPRRLGRRYLWGNPRFVFAAFRSRNRP